MSQSDVGQVVICSLCSQVVDIPVDLEKLKWPKLIPFLRDFLISDVVPDEICVDCFQNVLECYKFREKCWNNLEKLKIRSTHNTKILGYTAANRPVPPLTPTITTPGDTDIPLYSVPSSLTPVPDVEGPVLNTGEGATQTKNGETSQLTIVSDRIVNERLAAKTARQKLTEVIVEDPFQDDLSEDSPYVTPTHLSYSSDNDENELLCFPNKKQSINDLPVSDILDSWWLADPERKSGPKSKTMDIDENNRSSSAADDIIHYECEICKTICESFTSFVTHIQTVHVDVLDEKILKQFQRKLSKCISIRRNIHEGLRSKSSKNSGKRRLRVSSSPDRSQTVSESHDSTVDIAVSEEQDTPATTTNVEKVIAMDNTVFKVATKEELISPTKSNCDTIKILDAEDDALISISREVMCGAVELQNKLNAGMRSKSETVQTKCKKRRKVFEWKNLSAKAYSTCPNPNPVVKCLKLQVATKKTSTSLRYSSRNSASTSPTLHFKTLPINASGLHAELLGEVSDEILNTTRTIYSSEHRDKKDGLIETSDLRDQNQENVVNVMSDEEQHAQVDSVNHEDKESNIEFEGASIPIDQFHEDTQFTTEHFIEVETSNNNNNFNEGEDFRNEMKRISPQQQEHTFEVIDEELIPNDENEHYIEEDELVRAKLDKELNEAAVDSVDEERMEKARQHFQEDKLDHITHHDWEEEIDFGESQFEKDSEDATINQCREVDVASENGDNPSHPTVENYTRNTRETIAIHLPEEKKEEEVKRRSKIQVRSFAVMKNSNVLTMNPSWISLPDHQRFESSPCSSELNQPNMLIMNNNCDVRCPPSSITNRVVVDSTSDQNRVMELSKVAKDDGFCSTSPNIALYPVPCITQNGISSSRNSGPIVSHTYKCVVTNHSHSSFSNHQMMPSSVHSSSRDQQTVQLGSNVQANTVNSPMTMFSYNNSSKTNGQTEQSRRFVQGGQQTTEPL